MPLRVEKGLVEAMFALLPDSILSSRGEEVPLRLSDGLEPPTLSFCSLRLDFTAKYAMWVFGIGNLIQTDSGRKRFPESWIT